MLPMTLPRVVAFSLCAILGADAGSNRINKHTYSSDDGRGDYAFINKYFCSADTSSADFKCAVDMKASCSGFAVHMVQSYVTKNGTETPSDWFGLASY